MLVFPLDLWLCAYPLNGRLPKSGQRTRLFYPLRDFQGEPASPQDKHTPEATGCQTCQNTQGKMRMRYESNKQFQHRYTTIHLLWLKRECAGKL